MTRGEVEAVNRLVSQGGLTTYSGETVTDELDSAFVTVDGRYAYRLDSGILRLLANTSIVLADHPDFPRVDDAQALHNPDKESVKAFYEETGWKKVAGQYVDGILFSDQRDVTAEYRRRYSERLCRHIKREGKYLLDVASGPVPDGPDTVYAQGYDFHVCIDISYAALQNARNNLGHRGLCIQGDILNLPIKDDVVDNVVSLHTVYHLPKDEQQNAFLEIHRVLKPGSNAVVVYNWGRHATLINLLILPVQVYRYLKKRLMPVRKSGRATIKSLYFYAHSPRWFKTQAWPFDYELHVFRSLNTAFLKVYIHHWLGGRALLSLVYRLEERFPQRAAQLCYFPMFVIKKLGKPQSG